MSTVGCIGFCRETAALSVSAVRERIGFREVALFSEYTDPETALKLKNKELWWPKGAVALYRFTKNLFSKDDVWLYDVEFVGSQPNLLMASDSIPQDICPIHSNLESMYIIGKDSTTSFQTIDLKSSQVQKNDDYAYTVVMQLFPTDHWCDT